MTMYQQNDDGSYSVAEPMGWQDAGVEWEIYEDESDGYHRAFAYRGAGLLKMVEGRNHAWWAIRVRLWNIYLHWKNR